jgi:histone H3/H4
MSNEEIILPVGGKPYETAKVVETKNNSLPLIVVANVKKTVKKESGFNTSADVIKVLNNYVNKILKKAMNNAFNYKRKTILGRDLE